MWEIDNIVFFTPRTTEILQGKEGPGKMVSMDLIHLAQKHDFMS